MRIPVYDAEDAASLTAAIDTSRGALLAYNAAKATFAISEVAIGKSSRLIGIDDGVYRQIEAAIKSEKRHLMLYGPPGTGKTELAREIAAQISSKEYILVTGSADWTSQDLIGGYQPTGNGQIAFVPGILLKHFDSPFIIDELNRCDIDKVLGPMFTVLSGHTTTLPYRVNVADRNSEQYRIFGTFQPDATATDFSPGPDWRIIATINTVDKASLYQMSYALSRRFAWIFVDVPGDLDAFLVEFISKRKAKKLTLEAGLPLAKVWEAVNGARPLGAAPFIDIINHCLAEDDGFDFAAASGGSQAETYLDAFMVNIVPMLDGVLKDEMRRIAAEVSEIIGLSDDGARTLERRMASVGL